MKIALLTNMLHTKDQHINIGDVFIRMGMQYILEQSYEHDIEWGLFSRFAKLTDEVIEQMKAYDLIIYAGMPQYNNLDDWSFYYDNEIWDDIRKIGKPVMKLAGGGGYPSENATPKDFADYLNESELTKKVLMSTTDIVEAFTTRDSLSNAFLASNGIKTTLLPCTGTFACLAHKPNTRTTGRYNAICLTASFLKKHKNKRILIKELKKTKQYLEETTGKKCLLISQVYKNDTQFLIDTFGEEDVIAEKNALDIIEHYYDIDICITTRLHCALPIYGIGGRPVMLRVDSRGIAVKECDIPIINLSDFTLEKFKNIHENDLYANDNMDAITRTCKVVYNNLLKNINDKYKIDKI